MKYLVFVALVLLISCGSSTQTLSKSSVNKKAIDEGIVASKKVPTSIKGYVYNASVNVFFRKDISKTVRKRIVSSIKKGKKLKNKQGRLKTNPTPNQLKEPYWADYFGETPVSGSVMFNLRIDKKGTPDIIVIEEGINPEANTIAAKYLSESTFKPGIHAKKNIPVRSWIKIKKTYN